MGYETFSEEAVSVTDLPEWYQAEIFNAKTWLEAADQNTISMTVEARTQSVFEQYDAFQREVRSSFYILVSPIVAIGAIISIAHQYQNMWHLIALVCILLMLIAAKIAQSLMKSLRIKYQQYISANISASIIRSAAGQNDHPWFDFTYLLAKDLKPSSKWDFVNKWSDRPPNIYLHNSNLIRGYSIALCLCALVAVAVLLYQLGLGRWY